MNNEERIIAFDNRNIISKASGNHFTADKVLEKLLVRSTLESKQAIRFLPDSLYKSDYSDIDGILRLEYKTKSQWSDSPEVDLTVDLPVHVTCNDKLHLGFGSDGRETDWSKVEAYFTITYGEGGFDEGFTRLNLFLDDKKVFEAVEHVFNASVENLKNGLLRNHIFRQSF